MHTKHLLIRPFTVEDAEEYFPLVSHPDVLRYTGESPATSLDDVRQILLTRPISDYSKYGFGRMACIDKDSGRLIGFSGLKYLPDLNEVDIGYRFLPDFWGKGYATESAKAIIDQVAPTHKLKRIIGLAYPENSASIHVLIKLGLNFEKKIKLEGDSTDLNMYSIKWKSGSPGFKKSDT
jgi:ribosomal-protein-alanine N-acetyltransferase